ncbi:MAG: hypothetical protein M3N07_01955 [Pseudomonadota bacterium]|nr:hypothetical protein [Pseudomonadota bacterium]
MISAVLDSTFYIICDVGARVSRWLDWLGRWFGEDGEHKIRLLQNHLSVASNRAGLPQTGSHRLGSHLSQLFLRDNCSRLDERHPLGRSMVEVNCAGRRVGFVGTFGRDRREINLTGLARSSLCGERPIRVAPEPYPSGEREEGRERTEASPAPSPSPRAVRLDSIQAAREFPAADP